MDTTKRAESLVDRFCSKFTAEEDFRINRSITLCLSLITYNDKALRKLHEKFPTYKSHLHDAEIYAMFKEIIETCSKPKPGKTDLKVTEYIAVAGYGYVNMVGSTDYRMNYNFCK